MEITKVMLKRRNGSRELKDLFIYTSLKCNLRCSHCFVSSSPDNDALDTMTFSDAYPIIDEAESFGVKEIYFTGGEPFIAKDIIPMIDYALRRAKTTVYTNATGLLEKKIEELSQTRKRHDNDFLLRISLDHYDPEIHDVFHNRGKGRFNESVEISTKAAKLGIPISITAQEDIHNHASEEYVEKQFRQLYEQKGVHLIDVKVLPNIPQGAQLKRTTNKEESPISVNETIPEDLMCGTSRTIIKYDGEVRVFPCTILIPESKEDYKNLARYEMGRTLKESFEKAQPLDHPSCRAYCVKGGATCANR